MNKIDKITMEYMSNKNYNEFIEQSKNEDQILYDKDERFYKKRLYVLYKDLFKNKKDVNKNIIIAFERFNKICIDVLKQNDTIEIVQNQLNNLPEKQVSFDESIPLEYTCSSEHNNQRDMEAFQNNNIKSCTLDNYIIKKPNKKQLHPPPQKIKVKLKTKELKNKDVYKKNIHKKYDNATKENIEK
jgi:hypothetical protein